MNLGRAVLATIAALLGFALVLPVLVGLLPFWTVGLLTRGLAKWLGNRALEWDQLIEFHPEVGWKPKANLDAHALDHNGDTFHLTTDTRGWRGGGTLEESEVVVFGDSYAFGYGVDDTAFFADLFQDVRIKAIGCPGYSMVQPVLWMEKLKDRLKDKLVVWLVYEGNDLIDNISPSVLHYRSPFARRPNGSDRWTIETGHVDRSRWTASSGERGTESFVELCSPTPLSRRVFEACDYLLERGRDICEEAGARLVVLTVPELAPVAREEIERVLAESRNADGFNEDLPDIRVSESCRRLGIRFVSLKRHLSSDDYLKRDFHWNPEGHRRVAEVIRHLYNIRGPESSDRVAAPTADRAVSHSTAARP